MNYEDFLKNKITIDMETGIKHIPELSEYLFEHQKAITSWALRRGRAAVFAGTGLGKTLIELEWANIVSKHTGKPVIIFAPLAVSKQHIKEGKKFGIKSELSDGNVNGKSMIYVTNYQKIDRFDLSKFGGVVLDESSILKSTTGKYRSKLIQECKQIPFRLAATATPAPNDFMEIGNHAEFLGVCSYTDMLATFFVHDGGDTQKWRLKGHGGDAFWKWMASWAVMLRMPSDLGYSDDGYHLPELTQTQHLVRVDYKPSIDTGFLFPMEARTLQERISARRSSIADRVRLASSITPPNESYVWWCNLNDESDLLVKSIPGAVGVKGSDKDDIKEQKLDAFSNGEIRVLVTKPSIAGFGMNWQHCSRTGFVGLNDSFEQVYQAIRRFWRFGQKNPVNVDFISAETEGAVIQNLRRKEADANRMASEMVAHMADLSKENIEGHVADNEQYDPEMQMLLPKFMRV